MAWYSSFLYEPISPKGVENLKGYRYAGVDHSIIYRLMQPVLQFYLTHIVPLWIAPNMLTLLGLLAMVVAYVLLGVVFCADVASEAPRWVYVVCAICKYLYQALDELDGKQARRTQTGSPLGELFDHGCDALSCVMNTVTMACMLQLGPGLLFWTFNTLVLMEFYFTLWEQYHTNFLELHYLGPNEAHTSYILLMLTTAVLGPQFWFTTVNLFGLAVSLRVLLFGILVFGMVHNFVVNLLKVRPVIQRGEASLSSAAFLLTPVVATAALSYVWYRVSPENVFAKHPQLFAFVVAVINSHQVGTLILSRVTKEPPQPYVHSMLALLAVVFTSVVFPSHLVNETFQLWLLTVVVCVLYTRFAASVVMQLATVLNIRVLHIPYPPPTHKHDTAAHHAHTNDAATAEPAVAPSRSRSQSRTQTQSRAGVKSPARDRRPPSRQSSETVSSPRRRGRPPSQTDAKAGV